MCLHPIYIRNPTKRVNSSGGQLLKMHVPCGKCADCKKHKRTEWHFRTYKEIEHVIKNGGYVYFDTLTYSNRHLPMLSHYFDIKKYKCKDFMCFDNSHWRNFLKNLRRQLDYHYKGSKFRYFLVSEYGTDDRFTHRPHYHVLFFMQNKVIDPLKLSLLISKCWKYGRTDGIKYHPLPHVAKHIYGYNVGFGSNDDMHALSSICSYVAKYVTKESTFEKNIQNRKKYLSAYISSDELLKDIFNRIDMFHRQSQGIGISFISELLSMDFKNLLCSNVCRIPSSKKVVTTLSLPLYYIRHLFYTNKRASDGHYYWELNERGKEYMIDKLINSVSVINDMYVQKYINATPDQKYIIDDILCDTRTLYDFAVYKVFYQGRLRYISSLSFKDYMQTSRLSDVEYNIYDWMQIIIGSNVVYTDDGPMKFSVDDNVVRIQKSLISSDIFDTDFIELSYKDFVEYYTFNERSDASFKRFDELDDFFFSICKKSNERLQQTFDYIEDLKNRLKHLK